MKALYRITINRKINNLVEGMWVEVISTYTGKPSPKEIADAFNQKYGKGIVNGTIASYALDIVKVS